MEDQKKIIYDRIKLLTDEINYFLDLIYSSPSVYTSYVILGQLKAKVDEIRSLNDMLASEFSTEPPFVPINYDVLPFMTVSELAQYNGVDNNRGYVAANGIVYDVTDNQVWNSRHAALGLGRDLSQFFNTCHGKQRVLHRLPAVARLESYGQPELPEQRELPE